MPEGPEVETERLHETIHEELHKDGGTFLKVIALSTAILAALAALGSFQAGATVNESLALKTEATRFQAEASDQWAYYQAKGVKTAVQEAIRATWLVAGKEPPAELAEKAKRYGEEQEKISERAKELERERDAKLVEAEHLMHQHHRFAIGVALLQVAIALGAVAALTRVKAVWGLSMVGGAAGLVLLATGMLLH